MTSREIISEFVLEPGTGKAIELLKGQILRVEQVEGGQCADFNAFNLHDYKEFMHCGRTRTVHGFHPTKGTFMWSAPPRERDRPADPNSPFAKLAALKEQLTANRKDR